MKLSISEQHLQIGLRVKQYREEHCISQEAFAKQCKINLEVLKRIERGEVNFRLTTLIRLIQQTGNSLFIPVKKS